MTWIDDHTRMLQVDGLSVRMFEHGEGPPVVVLHGWGGRIESMAPVLRCLNGYRVIALDLPGFGESPLPPEPWGTDRYAALVRSVLADLNIPRASFVGHSYGAKTSLYLAATASELVDKLVLQGSSGLRTPPSFAVRVKRWLSAVGRAAARLGPPGRALRDALYRRIASGDYADAGPLRPTLVKVVNEDLKDLLPSVRASTLLIWGSEDDAAPVSHARIMERAIPDAGLVIFERAGHFAYLDEPDRFCRIVTHFLRGDTA